MNDAEKATKTPIEEIEAIARGGACAMRAQNDFVKVAASVADFELQCCIAAAAFAARRVHRRVTQLLAAQVEKEDAQEEVQDG